MRKERIDEDEIYAVVRSMGLSSLEEADAIVLETDGSFNLIQDAKNLKTETMNKVITPHNLAGGE